MLVSVICIIPGFIIFAANLFPQDAGQQAKLIVVKSKDLPEYEESYKGFMDTLNKGEFDVNPLVFSLDHLQYPNENIIDAIEHQQPDLVLTIGSAAAKLICGKVTRYPILFLMVLNPERQGILQNGGHPFPNVSGVCLDIPPEVETEYIKKSLGQIRKIAILQHPTDDSTYIESVKRAAMNTDFEVAAGKIKTNEDIPSVLKNLRNHNDILWLTANPSLSSFALLKYIFRFCISNNFPILGLSEYHVKAGALLAIRADYFDNGEQAGELALEILRTGPLERQIILSPRKTRLFINRRTADMLSIDIPPEVLKQADQIME
ncbi:hypothetical protein JXJ21_13105 [candidate division KSB1 bacterium]|nr:hypothetical protein [candidate division KSB1 bacterium]